MFKNLYFMLSQVVIIDVVSLDKCICQTDEGSLLEGVHTTDAKYIIFC